MAAGFGTFAFYSALKVVAWFRFFFILKCSSKWTVERNVCKFCVLTKYLFFGILKILQYFEKLGTWIWESIVDLFLGSESCSGTSALLKFFICLGFNSLYCPQVAKYGSTVLEISMHHFRKKLLTYSTWQKACQCAQQKPLSLHRHSVQSIVILSILAFCTCTSRSLHI